MTTEQFEYVFAVFWLTAFAVIMGIRKRLAPAATEKGEGK
jgi:hypothetical protein